MSTPNKVPCPACGGSALSPYPDDGGSCPHCFNGEVEAVEQMRAADAPLCSACGLEPVYENNLCWNCLPG